MTGKIELLTALAFEDIRTEQTGQLMLIGNISTQVGALSFPTRMVMDVIVIARVNGLGLAEAEFRLQTPDNEAVVSGGIGVEITEDDDAALLSLSTMIFDVAAPGDVTLKWRVKGSKLWKNLKTWRFTHHEASTDSDVSVG